MNPGLFENIELHPAPTHSLGRKDHLTFRGNVASGRHGWLRLTPAYSLKLVQTLLGELGPADRVLEPFSGTGTTPLACAAAGVPCDGVDINPFLVWLAGVKLAHFADSTGAAALEAAHQIEQQAQNPNTAAWRPAIHQLDKWWDTPTLNTLATLLEGIKSAQAELPPGTADLLRVAFCRVMIATANVSFGHQSMSFNKQAPGHAAGLLVETPSQCAHRVAHAFLAAAKDVVAGTFIGAPLVDASVVLGDSRKLERIFAGKKFTAVITSPPYPNRMSYIRELRPYMYWLGFLSDGRTAGELDWKAIGGTWGCATSMLNAWTPNPDAQIPFPEFNSIVAAIGRGHALLGRYVHRYFEDIKTHLLSLREVLAPQARCRYIVGNSKFYDTMLPVEQIYAALFKGAGFANIHIETIRKRTSKKELYEFIVHAQMPA